MSKPEKEFLEYRGNHVPRFIRFAWTVFFLFAAIYLVRHLWPDLVEWWGRLP